MPSISDRRPARLRIPAVYAGAATFDVYQLLDDTDWPEQDLLRHKSMIPRTTTDQTEAH